MEAVKKQERNNNTMTKSIQLITPNGFASYPHLTSPDTYQGKSEYNCKLVFDPRKPEVQDFKAKLDKYLESTTAEYLAEFTEKLSGMDANATGPKAIKAYAELKALINRLTDGDVRNPLTEEEDKEGNLTGNLVFTCKSKSEFTKKDGTVVSLAPKFHDASGNLMTGRPLISGGAELALSIAVLPYCMSASIGSGLTARINGVQIISLGGDGGGGGFAKQSGYTDTGIDQSSEGLATEEDEAEGSVY